MSKNAVIINPIPEPIFLTELVRLFLAISISPFTMVAKSSTDYKIIFATEVLSESDMALVSWGFISIAEVDMEQP